MWIADMKESDPCADCRKFYPAHVMDYDHVRGEKLFKISTATTKNYSRKRIVEEVAKCDLVCSNCHRERTYQRRIAAGEFYHGRVPESGLLGLVANQ